MTHNSVSFDPGHEMLWRGHRLLVVFSLACTSRKAIENSELAPSAPPALDAITEADLRNDLFALAGDAMRGREAGTLDELRASAWVADRAREAGLEPAGDDGTFFQFWPMRRTRTSDASSISVGGRNIQLWTDAVVIFPSDSAVDLPLVFVGEGRESDLAGVDIKGKAVVASISPPDNAPPAGVSLSARRYTQVAVRQRANFLTERGAAAVVLVSDSIAESQFESVGTVMQRGSYAMDTASGIRGKLRRAPTIWVRSSMLDEAKRAGARLVASLSTESFVYPSVNVVGVARGTDTARRGEYVLFSAHQDHDGVRHPVEGDSIWNGADDNATVSVAVIAIARAFAKRPGARSALFVWHGAEERGLLGSRWHAEHPVVPKSSIVAVLNADMIGRNHPDSASLLGSQPPHRNSAELVRMALDANTNVSRFAIDSSWDRPSHPEGWYFRSDHLPYARANIPAVYFTTLLHPDYHTPRDEPGRIDITKLARVTKWMYATGWTAANAEQRPRLDEGFKLER
ncbi:MAG: M28 family peptidase [Gemmatimonadaceae bacterium]|nr:M28 family peptidase [Gemmatimonadaceae bacterium]